MTGIQGAALTQNSMDRREREILRARVAIERKETVRTLSEFPSPNQQQGGLLVEAIRAGGPRHTVEEQADHYVEKAPRIAGDARDRGERL